MVVCKQGVNPGEGSTRFSREAVRTHHYRRSCNASYNGLKMNQSQLAIPEIKVVKKN